MTDHAILHSVAVARGNFHGNSRPLSVDCEYIGLVGEDTFAMAYGFQVDLATRPLGDGHKDFMTSAGNIEIRTYRKPYNLPIEANKPPYADIYVLCKYFTTEDYVTMLGWQYGVNILKMPVRCFPGYTIPNHCMPAELLYPMIELEILLRKGRR